MIINMLCIDEKVVLKLQKSITAKKIMVDKY